MNNCFSDTGYFILAMMKPTGEYPVRLYVSALTPSGYLVRLQAGGQSEVKKLVVQ